MAKGDELYHWIEVESFEPDDTSGRHGAVHIRPVAGQIYPPHLNVECSKKLSDPARYGVGSRFRIRAKLTDREGGGEFLYSYHGWNFEVIHLVSPAI